MPLTLAPAFNMTSFTKGLTGQLLPTRSASQPQRATRGRSRGVSVQAVLAGKPRSGGGSLDVDEHDLKNTDAFKQLVALSRKQSTNKPQPVRCVRARPGAAARFSSCVDPCDCKQIQLHFHTHMQR